MKRLFTIISLLLVLCPVASAQIKDSLQMTNLQDYSATYSKYSHNGSGTADAGKALMYTGASFAATGAFIFIAGAITFRQDPQAPTTPMYPSLAMGAGIAGAAIALIGLPFYLSGKNNMELNGATFLNVGADSKPGIAGIVDIGAGVPTHIGLDAVCGYNFNSKFFLGGGLSYKADFINRTSNGGVTMSVPVYAQARFTFDNKRTAPYAGINLGYDAKNVNFYSGVEFGVRIRSLRNTQNGSSCWIGTKTELIGRDLGFLSLKFSKSF